MIACRAQQLAGQAVDHRELVAIGEALETALRSAEFVTGPGGLRTGSAQKRLREMIERTVLGPDPDAQERELARDPDRARARFEAQLQEAVAKFGPTPASGDVGDADALPHPSPQSDVAAGGGLPLLVESAPAASNETPDLS